MIAPPHFTQVRISNRNASSGPWFGGLAPVISASWRGVEWNAVQEVSTVVSRSNRNYNSEIDAWSKGIRESVTDQKGMKQLSSFQHAYSRLPLL
jgi:hypothetical protein